MSLFEKMKFIEESNLKIRRTFYVFYEGDQAERSLVGSLKSSFNNLIVTPVECGIQISKFDIISDFKNKIESLRMSVEEKDRIVYICDMDNVLDTQQNMKNFMRCYLSDEIDLYYTFPCIELICHMYNGDSTTYKNMSKEEIQRDKNSVISDLGFDCFKGTMFNRNFLKKLSINEYDSFIKSAEELIEVQTLNHGEFAFDNLGEKYLIGNIKKIINERINHTTLHQFIKKLKILNEE